MLVRINLKFSPCRSNCRRRLTGRALTDEGDNALIPRNHGGVQSEIGRRGQILVHRDVVRKKHEKVVVACSAPGTRSFSNAPIVHGSF